jgi:hypothetical protein
MAGRSAPDCSAVRAARRMVSRWCRGRSSADARAHARGLRARVGGRRRALQARGQVPSRCDRCGCRSHGDLPGPENPYLLGIYLGDGCLATAGRTVALRIVMDAAYPRSSKRSALGSWRPAVPGTVSAIGRGTSAAWCSRLHQRCRPWRRLSPGAWRRCRWRRGFEVVGRHLPVVSLGQAGIRSCVSGPRPGWWIARDGCQSSEVQQGVVFGRRDST